MTLPPIFYLILLLIVGLIMPLYAVLTGHKAVELLKEHPEYRLMIYQQTIFLQILLSGMVLMAMYWYGDDFAAIGLSFSANTWALLALFFLPLVFLALVWAIPANAAKAVQFRKTYQAVLYLLPQNRQEYNWSIPLSYVAGICEEIIFRGFLFWQLHQFLNLPTAILLTNIIFTLGHYATRLKNMILSFLFGILGSLSFWYFGHLWWAMLVHIMIDLYTLTTGYKMTPFPESAE